MNLEEFIYHLHFDTDQLFPSDWKVDWDDAPLPYKLYRGLPEIPLPAEVPLSIKTRDAEVMPDLTEIGQMLWYVFGITQYSQSAFVSRVTEADVNFAQSLRRFVPSGGALYPNELYVYLKLTEIPAGIYHYSAAHHRLVFIREGNFDSYLSRSLGNNCDISNCFGAIFVSTMFWKNFFKYHNFSYRLQGLDAGVIIGQTLAVADKMGLSTQVCFQFLDQPINHLLGLAAGEESIYAVIPLSVQKIVNKGEFTASVAAADLCNELPPVNHNTYQQSNRILDYSLLREINEASMLTSTASFVKHVSEQQMKGFLKPETVMLPFTETEANDLVSVLRERHSPNIDFILDNVSQTQIAVLLQETFSFPYLNDLDYGDGNIESRLALYGCVYHVEGIPDGAYEYDSNAHALMKISSGDYRGHLQSGMNMDNVNLIQVPLCFHIVGDKEHLIEKWGFRGYRIQQMEAGILVQRLLLAAGAIGMGGHPLLGFKAEPSDELYGIYSKGKTSLIQIPIGFYRPRAWLKGSLYS